MLFALLLRPGRSKLGKTKYWINGFDNTLNNDYEIDEYFTSEMLIIKREINIFKMFCHFYRYTTIKKKQGKDNKNKISFSKESISIQ